MSTALCCRGSLPLGSLPDRTREEGKKDVIGSWKQWYRCECATSNTQYNPRESSGEIPVIFREAVSGPHPDEEGANPGMLQNRKPELQNNENQTNEFRHSNKYKDAT